MTGVDWQSSLSSGAEHPSLPTGEAPRGPRMSIDIALLAGAAVMFLGAGLFALGLYHGFEYGSCSTTGYSRYYGPVQHCAKGVGWWMLLVFGGLCIVGAGAFLARSIAATAPGLIFIAVGAPFIALGLRSGNHQLLINSSSSSSGKIFALIFGACFAIAGLAWAGLALRGSLPNLSPVSGLGALVTGAAGVAIAFLIAGAISSGIGPTSASGFGTSTGPGGVTILSAAQARALRISNCKHIVNSFSTIEPADKARLTAECAKNPQAAQRQITAASRKGALAQASKQCQQGVAGETGLPPDARAALAAQCRQSTHGSNPNAGVQSTQAQVCRAIVKAQVPPSAQQQALASCPK